MFVQSSKFFFKVLRIFYSVIGLCYFFHFPNLPSGTLLVINYRDEGVGNVDVEINGTYVGTLYRFDTSHHFFAVFVFEDTQNLTVSVLPYENTFEIEYLVVYECLSS